MSQLVALGEHLFSVERVTKEAVRGNCRVWTREAIRETRQWAAEKGVVVTIEAREKEVEAGLDHTFLRISDGQTKFVYDGTGLYHHGPWFGEEKGSRYEDSREDMIQSILT